LERKKSFVKTLDWQIDWNRTSTSQASHQHYL
jgi:hypothetical protein